MKKAKEKEEKHVRDFPSFILKKMWGKFEKSIVLNNLISFPLTFS